MTFHTSGPATRSVGGGGGDCSSGYQLVQYEVDRLDDGEYDAYDEETTIFLECDRGNEVGNSFSETSGTRFEQ